MKSDVTLTLEKSSYVAGEVISGCVNITLTQEVKVKDLLVRIYGQTRVSWDEKRAYTKGSAPSVSCRNTESTLDHVIVLLKKDKIPTLLNTNKNATVLRPSPASSLQEMTSSFPSTSRTDPESDEGVLILPGDHNFHFEFTLPQNLPSSYEGKWGHVRYGVKASLERPWKFDIEREREFSVTSHCDLNEEPELVRPIGALGEFRIGLPCINRGLVNVDVRISRRGYVAGENIPFAVEIENNTPTKLYGAKMSLVQQITFRVGNKIKRINNVLTSLNTGEIMSQNTHSWNHETLTIPNDIVPSTSKNIRSIQIKYNITLSVKRATWQNEYSLPITIIVGTMPFRKGVIQSYLQMLGYNCTPRASPTTTPLLGRQAFNANGDMFVTSPPLGCGSTKPTPPVSLKSHDQSRMRRASALPGMLPIYNPKITARQDSSDSDSNSLHHISLRNGDAKHSRMGASLSSVANSRSKRNSDTEPKVSSKDAPISKDIVQRSGNRNHKQKSRISDDPFDMIADDPKKMKNSQSDVADKGNCLSKRHTLPIFNAQSKRHSCDGPALEAVKLGAILE